MAENKIDDHFLKDIEAHLENPNAFEKICTMAAKGLKDKGCKIDELPDFAMAVDEYIEDKIMPQKTTVGNLVFGHSLVYAFLINMYLAATNEMNPVAADECVKFFYTKMRILAEERELLDENGNLKK